MKSGFAIHSYFDAQPETPALFASSIYIYLNVEVLSSGRVESYPIKNRVLAKRFQSRREKSAQIREPKFVKTHKSSVFNPQKGLLITPFTANYYFYYVASGETPTAGVYWPLSYLLDEVSGLSWLDDSSGLTSSSVIVVTTGPKKTFPFPELYVWIEQREFYIVVFMYGKEFR